MVELVNLSLEQSTQVSTTTLRAATSGNNLAPSHWTIVSGNTYVPTNILTIAKHWLNSNYLGFAKLHLATFKLITTLT